MSYYNAKDIVGREYRINILLFCLILQSRLGKKRCSEESLYTVQVILMYLFVLLLCGLLLLGGVFLIYSIIEITIAIIIWIINKRKEAENLQSILKSVGGLVLCRFCSAIIWCIIFSVTNGLFTEKRDNGGEILDYWFPPDIAYYLIYPHWHLILTLGSCLLLTLTAFQMYLFKKKRLLYYITILITTLIMFCILTKEGLPLYWH
jgi:hypothetical protein